MDLKAGERLRVDTGCLVAFDPTVDYDIELVGGIKTALFGGEGLLFATMTGPGRVWVQTLPFLPSGGPDPGRIQSGSRRGEERLRRHIGSVGRLIGGDS